MNPFLQTYWRDIHVKLIAAMGTSLSEELPPDLVARTEEEVAVAQTGKDYRADVAVVEEWQRGLPPVWQPEEASALSRAVTEPIVIFVEPEQHRWLEVQDVHGRVITVIEVPSPTNKSEGGWRAYRQKQQDFLAAGVNLVEIDLLRGGQHVLDVPLNHFSRAPGESYLVCVARMQPGCAGRREVYPCPLRQPLPTIRVPLRAGDSDAPLALQPLIDECYRAGRYWLADHTRKLEPPLSAEDAAWMDERLQAAGLR